MPDERTLTLNITIGIVGHSTPGSITDKWRVGFEVSQQNAACQRELLGLARPYDRLADYLDRRLSMFGEGVRILFLYKRESGPLLSMVGKAEQQH